MLQITVFWDVTSSLVDAYHHFEGTCCLYSQSTRTLVNPEDGNIYQPNAISFQKTVICIVNAM